ncbi:putative polyketide synthase [Annulohypoxylon truncatum]|uniref:putative polyketide synthase n=1 Tax=Annulohypoxylon truncatum TaxID=327061 RepID=UPI002007EC7E|nr:putative polyketide synthase [Annulohypoxylon truncatum]KAI1208282.1 putative polyketide synthase [Annulohypoxylon truncatum]
MYRVAVFAGLGSDALFSRTTLDTAIQDASLPESQVILRACHAVFRTQITKAVEQGHLFPESVNLDDFAQPESLIRPSLTYHHNVVIQHTAIYLVQIFRFLSHSRGSHDVQGVAGFCAGLLPAAVVATSHNVIEFMQRAQDLFHVALWLGINSESYRHAELSRGGCSPNLPWSMVVHNISDDILAALISDTQIPVYVTARNSAGCVTLSGIGDQLAQFIEEKLPTKCRARPTNVFSLYHNRDRLSDIFHQTVEVLGQELSSQWEVPVAPAAPLFSTVTGEPLFISETSTTLGQLVSLLLEMILLEPVDWISVQDSVLSEIQHRADSEKCEILNFGPGYGVSKSTRQLPQAAEIRDVSAAGASSTSEAEASGISLDDIAIVGMAVDLPGASDADELWDNLCNGVNSCSEIPASRFHIDDFYQKKDEKGNRAKRSINTRYGNFLKNPFLFDNDLFDISPREAKSIDPQQRVLLQTSYRALEDAGYVPDSTPSFARDTFGCFVGNATLDYPENLRADIDVYYSPGTLRAFQSGRISYYFGWSGPSITLDTACSSSMVALHQAVRALTAGDCRAALVGGVNVITSPDMYLGLDRAHFLSPTGQCKAFDASADGYCRSEGCGIFIVKKMRDALAEGDRIHAIIKGIELNQSGNAHSITHPHSPTQEQLFRRLLDKTKIHPHQLTVVETHGTGTQAGDPNELESLRGALCRGRSPRNPVHFTSIKANVGHAEAASGAAALAKVVLMMKYGKIPPQVSLKNLNPKIQKLGVDGSMIDSEVTPWQQPGGGPRLALINNFGAAGSNAAVILRDYDVPVTPRLTLNGDAQTYVLGLSGKSTKVLNKLREELIADLTSTLSTGSPSLADICYTITARRQLYDYRISVTADSVEKLIKSLGSAQPNHVPIAKAPKLRIAFVFSGQGSQYLGMGQQLMSIYPTFSKTIHQCDQILKRNGFPGCLEIIDPSRATSTNQEDNSSQLQAFQSAIYALEVALAQLLISWNILPTLVVGHSLGEYAALVIAGVLDFSSGALLVARRAELMVTECEIGKTSMLAVNIGASDARAMIAGDSRFQQLTISCDNSRTDCVVGGPIPQLQAFKEHIKSAGGIKSKLLDVPVAYHTDAMDPILPELIKFANTVVLRKPSIPVVSNVLGHIVPAGEDVFTPDYFARHSRQTVAFQQGLDEYLVGSPDADTTHWVEIGPHASLLPMISTQATAAQAGLVPCLRKGISPSATLSQLLSHFYQKAAPVKWRQAFDFQDKPRLVNLTGLPFFQSEFVIPYPHETSSLLTGLPEKVQDTISGNVFLRRTVQKASESNDFTGIYETSIQSLKEFITGHIVCEHALCPASVYHQMALSAVQDMQPEKTTESAWSLSGITYVAPLLYTSQSTAVVRIRVSPSGGAQNDFSFEVSSFANGTDPGRGSAHCKGHLKCKIRKSAEQKYTRAARMLKRQIDRFIRPDPSIILETFSTKAMYENVFTRVVTYSKLYQQVQYIRISPECDEAYARCKSSSTPSNTPADSSAIFMDVLLHVAGFVANLSIASGEACICKEVESALVLREPASPGTMFDVHCTVIELSEEGLFIADAQATDEHGVMASFKGMAFQRVQLAKISQAFGIQSRRGQGMSNTPKTNAAPRPQQPAATKKVAENQPAISAPSSQSNLAMKNLIAQTCGAEPTDLSSESNLEAFGFDSLLMIELEAQLSSAYPSLDVSGLAECHTIGDIERLCSGQETIDTPPNSVVDMPNEDVSYVADDIPDIRKLTRAIIAETCNGNIDSIDSSSELSALGIDSLMIFELESSLSKISNGGYLSTSDLGECHTVGDVEKLILSSYPQLPTQDSSSAISSSNSSSSASRASLSGVTIPTAIPTVPVTPINSEPSQVLFGAATIDKVARILNLDQQPEIVQAAPSSQHTGHDKREPSLFLIHDGSGVCTHYHRLQPLGRPVYALHDPKLLDPFDGWASLGAMADEYARQIAAATAGPYLLGGWSFGGVVAFEAARRLLAQGHGVIGVVLIDAPAPVDHQPLSPRIIDAVTGQAKAPGTEAAKAIRALTRRSFASCASLLGAFTPESPAALPMPRVFLLRSREGWQDASDPDFFENEWLQDRRSPRGAISGWETVTASKVAWVDIPGNHFQVFDSANIEAVSTSIRRACVELEGAYSRV